ncbi:MAG TPA: site-specific integrase [Flavipsychrobacter sp.]|nr:site-specific integrase [Flavipsychrobacter sp.]
MSSIKIKAVLFTSKKLKDNTHPILIRITHDRKSIYKSIGYSAPIEAWDSENSRVFEKKPQISKRQEGQLNSEKIIALREIYKKAIVLSNATAINQAIANGLNSAETAKTYVNVVEKDVSIEKIKETLYPEKNVNRKLSFLSYAEEVRDRFLAKGSIGTHKNYKSVITKLSEYLGNKDLKFKDLNVQFLEKYESHLHSKNNSINTIYNNLKTLKAIYHNAIKEQLVTLEDNPFFAFKLSYNTNIQKAKLTIEEVKKIEEMEVESNSLEFHVKNFWLFSFYCAGIRVSDCLTLKWKNISPDGRLEYTMRKTDKFKSIILLPAALNILEDYKNDEITTEDYIFPFIKNEGALTKQLIFNQISSKTALINKYLKKISSDIGLNKTLTTHIARHSFSDFARKKNVSIYDISKMLGHHSIKITESYLSSLDIESQDKALKDIFNS